ncbi:O(6)-methylguanine-induced apoptosis 2, partial [Nibea albiflora]
VIRNEEKKGFSSQAKRFPSQVCLARRAFNNPKTDIPGPNSYNLQSSFIDKQDFNTGVSRVFRLPVAVQLDGPKHKTPAPNQYDVCHYDVNDNIIQQSPAVLSPFKSKTQRIPAPVDNRVPGPGAYNPHHTPALVKRTTLPRGYYQAISAPPLIVPKDPPLPGPGQYNIGSSNGPSNRPMLTAAFASKTERTSQKLRHDMNPGPDSTTGTSTSDSSPLALMEQLVFLFYVASGMIVYVPAHHRACLGELYREFVSCACATLRNDSNGTVYRLNANNGLYRAGPSSGGEADPIRQM